MGSKRNDRQNHSSDFKQKMTTATDAASNQTDPVPGASGEQAPKQKNNQKGTKALWDLFALSGAEVLGKLAGFIAFATLARLFSPDGYGAIELAFSFLMFFSSFIDFGLGPIGSREVARDHQQATAYSSLIPATRVLLLCAAIPLMAISAWLMNLPDSTVLLILVMSAALFTMPFNQKWLLQGLERMTWVSLGQAIHMLIFMLGVIVLVGQGASPLLVGTIEVMAAAATAAWFLFMQYRIGLPLRLRFDRRAIQHLLVQAMPVGTGKIVWALNQNLPILLVGVLGNAIEVAWYAVAIRVVNALISFNMIYHFNLYPNVVSRLQQSHESFLTLSEPSFRLCAWAGTFVALVGSLIAESVIVLAFGSNYAPGSTTLSILIWIVPVMLLSSHARWALVASNNQQYVLHAQIGGVIVCAIICFLLVPRYGATGACLAMVFSSLTVWLISYYYASRKVGRMPWLSCVAPLLGALCIVLAAKVLPVSNWQTLGGGVVLYCLLIPLFGRQLPNDIRTLVQIKNMPIIDSSAKT